MKVNTIKTKALKNCEVEASKIKDSEIRNF